MTMPLLLRLSYKVDDLRGTPGAVEVGGTFGQRFCPGGPRLRGGFVGFGWIWQGGKRREDRREERKREEKKREEKKREEKRREEERREEESERRLFWGQLCARARCCLPLVQDLAAKHRASLFLVLGGHPQPIVFLCFLQVLDMAAG